MSKKSNTIFFMIGATFFNVILLAVIFLVGIMVTLLLAGENANVATAGLVISFVVAIALSMFIYSKVLNWVIKKWDLENKLDPIFTSRRRK